LNPDHTIAAKKIVKQIAADYRLVDTTDGQINVIAQSTVAYVMQQLGNLKKTMIGAVVPPYVITQWSEISVKRRSIYGKPSATSKGYVSAMLLADSDLIDLTLFCRSFPPDTTGSTHTSHMFVSEAVWKIDVSLSNTPKMPHQKERKMIGMFVGATDTKIKKQLLDGGVASEYITTVAEIRERCLRKSKKDQMRAIILPEMKSPCGLTYSFKSDAKGNSFGMAELSQIVSLFGEGDLSVFVSRRRIVFSNRYFTYLIEWKK